jgi:hypothetical protein
LASVEIMPEQPKLKSWVEGRLRIGGKLFRTNMALLIKTILETMEVIGDCT